MISFDRTRAESSPALTLKPVAASTTAIIPKNPPSDFSLIVTPLRLRSARYHASREIWNPENETRTLRYERHPADRMSALGLGCVKTLRRSMAREKVIRPRPFYA